jgi:hypothetical protein
MADAVRTAIDDLLDRFVESLRPAHDRIAAAPYAAIEVRKTELRAAAAELLHAHAAYLTAAARSLTAPTPKSPGGPDHA